jgi:hypothetical protein
MVDLSSVLVKSSVAGGEPVGALLPVKTPTKGNWRPSSSDPSSKPEMPLYESMSESQP